MLDAKTEIASGPNDSGNLATLIDGFRHLFEGDLARVEDLLEECTRSAGFSPGPYSLTNTLVGLPLLRPSLTISFAHMSGDNSEEILKLACAVELMRNAIELHKKHSPSSNRNAMKILAGDFLLSKSFSLMIEANSIGALEILAKASEIVLEGEIKVLQKHNASSALPYDYSALIDKRTDTLFGAACEVSTIVNRAPLSQISAAKSFGQNIGFACQLVDDFYVFRESPQLEQLLKEKVQKAREALLFFPPSIWRAELKSLCERVERLKRNPD